MQITIMIIFYKQNTIFSQGSIKGPLEKHRTTESRSLCCFVDVKFCNVLKTKLIMFSRLQFSFKHYFVKYDTKFLIFYSIFKTKILDNF